MQLPITYRVKMKDGLFVEVELWGVSGQDTDGMRRAASLLAHMAKAIDGWKAQQGSPGTPMPAPNDAALEEARR